MRTILFSIFTAVLVFVSAEVFAQPPVNAFHVYTDRTSFTSRGFLAGAAGEILQGYPGDQFRGIGDVGQNDVDTGNAKRCKVHGFNMITQDQDQSTPETYWIVFRRANDRKRHDKGSPGELIARFGPFDLPTGPGSGVISWSINVNFGPDGVTVPCSETFFAGVELSANSNWTADGQSLHASAYTNPTSTQGDPVRADAPNNAWQIDADGIRRMTNPRTWNITLRTQRGAFQVGCIQPANPTVGLYGSCGNYPDLTVQGLAFRIRDAASANMKVQLVYSDSLTGGAKSTFDGHYWIGPGSVEVIAEGTLDGNGFIEFMPAMTAPGSDFLMSLIGTDNLPFQAVIVDDDDNVVRATNAQATSPNP